ncbi:MAG: glycoside hydrolase family 99-like domain-containing protein [Pseudomonadota bacterium]
MKNYRRARIPLIGRLLTHSGSKATDESNRALRAIENQLFISTDQTRAYLERMDGVLPAVPGRQYAGTRAPVALAQLYHCAEENRTYDLAQERHAHAGYLAAIGASKLFDADFYRATYAVEQAFEHQPELHYVLFGEKKGWQPNAVFWPDNYLIFNTDVAAAGHRPFRHFIDIGRFESRVSRPLPPLEGGLATPMPTLRQRGFASPKKIAVCLHVFYVDLWPELVENLRRLSMPFDLFVGLVDRGQPLDDAKASVAASFPNARVFVFPNHGRDIFPFVSMAAAGLFDPYEAVCKIHTKKSPHRDDGAVWRNTLVNGILPKQRADKLLAAFLANPDWGLMVADGQIYDGQQWWGSNKELVSRLLHRVEIRPDLDQLHFPAGSIYWIKQPLINLVRGMQLGADDFDPEARQLDGTPAHAFERVLGYLGAVAGVDIVDTSTVAKAVGKSRPAKALRKPFVSCFYLPQFHRVPENDAWWGKGYTEWVGVSRARAQFDGHYHPVTPAGSGYYDLRNPEVIGEQFALAKAHGVDAFCVYYYAFDNGKRLLEAPIDNLLTRPDIDACFYLCWANESWTRNWDGMSGEVLMAQTYLPNCVHLLAEDTSRYFADPRYFRLHGSAPRFVIYRPEDIPNLPEFIEALRAAWAAKGYPKVNLGAVLFHTAGESSEASAALFDFIVEMAPHGLVKPTGWIVNKDAPTHDPAFPVRNSFKGTVYSYDHVIEQSLKRELPAYLEGKIVRGVMPSWDNTARRGSTAHICYGGNPAAFGRWVKDLAASDIERSELMVNSWNEWAEKAMIEPACQYGNGYLDALKRAFAGMAPHALAQAPIAATVNAQTASPGANGIGQGARGGNKRRAR